MEPSILMKKLIEEFPNNLLEALSIAKKVTFKKPKNTIQNVVICGMGGSGIGGRIVAQWLEKDLTVPVNFCQDYHLPSYVNQNTLVIASSYSGNTEETEELSTTSCVNTTVGKGRSGKRLRKLR